MDIWQQELKENRRGDEMRVDEKKKLGGEEIPDTWSMITLPITLIIPFPGNVRNSMGTVLNLLFSDGIEKIETDRLIDGQKNRQIDWHTQTDR